jgi:hypothetical protein
MGFRRSPVGKSVADGSHYVLVFPFSRNAVCHTHSARYWRYCDSVPIGHSSRSCRSCFHRRVVGYSFLDWGRQLPIATPFAFRLLRHRPHPPQPIRSLAALVRSSLARVAPTALPRAIRAAQPEGTTGSLHPRPNGSGPLLAARTVGGRIEFRRRTDVFEDTVITVGIAGRAGRPPVFDK